VMAATLVLSRVTIGRHLDLVGHRRVLLPCLATPAVGLALLAFAGSRLTIALAAVIFGLGFGLMYPTFTAYVFTHVHDRRRGAAYGAMLAAFDTGIGTGSTTLGWLIGRVGFRVSFGLAAGIAALALPYFLIAEKRLGFRD
jgi:MFS family permease